MYSEVHQALLHHHEQQQASINNDHFKSFKILKSAVKIITSNTKFMFFLILSILPFFAFIVFYEIEIGQVVNHAISNFLIQPSSTKTYYFDGYVIKHDKNDPLRKRLRIVLEFSPLYILLFPLLQLFSLHIIINVAAKTYARKVETEESSSTLKETIYEAFYQENSVKGPLNTSLWVQLLSRCTILGLFWTILSQFFVAYCVVFESTIAEILSICIHLLMFVALLYKYIDWSVWWNMGMVVSILQREAGVYSLNMSAYYGKQSKRTGFQLMLIFFGYNVVLRLPFILVRVFDYEDVRVVLTVIVIGLVCLGDLVKWVALVLYYYDCKAQRLAKKVDGEVVKDVKSSDLC